MLIAARRAWASRGHDDARHAVDHHRDVPRPGGTAAAIGFWRAPTGVGIALARSSAAWWSWPSSAPGARQLASDAEPAVLPPPPVLRRGLLVALVTFGCSRAVRATQYLRSAWLLALQAGPCCPRRHRVIAPLSAAPSPSSDQADRGGRLLAIAAGLWLSASSTATTYTGDPARSHPARRRAAWPSRRYRVGHGLAARRAHRRRLRHQRRVLADPRRARRRRHRQPAEHPYQTRYQHAGPLSHPALVTQPSSS